MAQTKTEARPGKNGKTEDQAAGTVVAAEEGDGLSLPNYVDGGGQTMDDMRAGALPGAEFWLQERLRELGGLVGSQSHGIHEMEREVEALTDGLDNMSKKLESVQAELVARRKVREANQTALDFVQESLKRIQEEGRNGTTERY